MLGAIGAVSLATPFLPFIYAQRWFRLAVHDPDRAGSGRVAAVTVLLLRSLANRQTTGRSFCRWRVRAVLCRTRHQHVALYRAAEHHDLAGGIAAKQPLFMLFGVAILIRSFSATRVGLLRVPRQGDGRLSLTPAEQNQRPLAQRLLWFAGALLGASAACHRGLMACGSGSPEVRLFGTRFRDPRIAKIASIPAT